MITNSIASHTTNSYVFTADAGNRVVLRTGKLSGGSYFGPWLRVYGPDGALVGDGGVSGAGAEEVALTTTNSGTFTVLVSDGSYPNGDNGEAGTYQLNYIKIPGTFVVSPGDEGGPLTNGTLNTGTITIGDLDAWSFTANQGDNLVVRVGKLSGGSYFGPWLRVYGPDGALVGDGGASGANAEEVTLTATNSGTYTVLVADGSYPNGDIGESGTYQLNYVKVPGNPVVSPGDEGGPLTNGTYNAASITAGDLDAWSFTASAGDSAIVRVGKLSGGSYFEPWLRVYGPDGALVGAGGESGALAEEVALTATNSGTYTVVVADGSYPNGDIGEAGDYQLSYVKVPGSLVESPGHAGGPLVNGTLNDGSLTNGEINAWSFSADSGDSVIARVGKLSGNSYFRPWLRVYGPDGALVGDGGEAGAGAEEVALTATNSGTFTVLVADGSYPNGDIGEAGTYQLNYVKVPGSPVVSPGDAGGPLTNGTYNAASLTVGDLDAWSFTANSGDNVILRVGKLSGNSYFEPWLRVYGPDGALVGAGGESGALAEEVDLTATNSGTYTVLVADGSYPNGDIGEPGDYQLSYVKVPGSLVVSPGQAGGPLLNGTLNEGTLTNGEINAWSFKANSGNAVVLRVGKLSGNSYFEPWMRVFGPDGALVGDGGEAGAAAEGVTLTATNSGTYTVLISDGSYPNGDYGEAGSYQLSLAQSPGEVFVSPGDEGGVMTNGFFYTGTNSIGDLDVWSFYGTAGDSNVFRIGTTNFTPWLRLYGPSGALVAQAVTQNQGNRTNSLSYVVTNSGPYTLVSTAYYLGQTGTYGLKQSRVPPDLIVPETQVLDEGATLNVSLSAQDPDVPYQPLTFTPISVPAGASFSQAGPTNAVITWPTSEATGPSTNVIVASVTDVVNGEPFTRTNRFTVVVNEVNQPPQLTVPGPQTLDELTTLQVSASATDPDLPANPLTFSLASAPPGMSIDPSTGAISWTPTEAQGPSTNTVTVVVTDSNPWAVNSKHLSATNSFPVIVREVNVAPQLVVPPTQTIDELTALHVSAAATDSDIPVNPLTFSLVAPPAGMTINPITGAISWTPTEAQGPSTNLVTVVVTDSNPAAVNATHLSTTNHFIVNVQEVNTAPQLTVPGNQTLDELTSLNVTATATDSDIPANPLTFSLVSPPTGMTIDPTTGAISWTPTEAQGPSTNEITVVVTDDNPLAVNAQHMSATNSFQVIVREVNTAPKLASISNQSIHYGVLLSIQATATDSDQPTNTLTFSLDQAPTNMTISAAGGLITWTPLQSQVGTYTVIVRVTDNGVPPLSATQSFQVTVNGSGAKLAIVRLAGGLEELDLSGDIGAQYDLEVSTNLVDWSSLLHVNLSSSPYPYIDPASATAPKRFYRLKLTQ